MSEGFSQNDAIRWGSAWRPARCFRRPAENFLVPDGRTVWFARVTPRTSRRDADWCDRDGRAPRFKRIVGLALSRARLLHNFGFNFVRREVAGVVRTEAADVKEAENRIHV